MDFHWGEYTYNLAGGSEIFLSELLTILSASGADGADKLAEIVANMGQIENVTFSNPELLKIEKQSSEQAEIDWLLTSLAAFDTEEKLAITLANGEEIVVRVTDEVSVDVQAMIDSGAIARVSNDGGASWKYHLVLVNATETVSDPVYDQGAFDYANTLSDSVIIETLMETNGGYSLTRAFTFNKPTSVTIRTTSDPSINENGFRSKLIKNQSGTINPMIILDNAKARLTVEDLMFDGSSQITSGNGALIRVTKDSSNITITNTSFKNGDASGYFGAVYSYGTVSLVNPEATDEILFKDCHVTDTGDQGGGAVHFGKGMTISGGEGMGNQGTVRFEGCTSKKDGGAIASNYNSSPLGFRAERNEGTIEFINCSTNVSGASSGSEGGALFVYYGGIVIENIGNGKTSFIGCSSNSTGGALATWGNPGTITITGTETNSVKFENCSAPNGGAIRKNNSNTTTTLTNVEFDNCTCTGNGGAVNIEGVLNVDSCRFDTCRANSNGGAIYANSTLTLSESTFISCKTTTTNTNEGGGGAVRVNGTADVERCAFTSCTAGVVDTNIGNRAQGGGLYANSTLILTGCTFTACKATNRSSNDYARGGGLFANGNSTITNCIFTGCESRNGGAMSVAGGSMSGVTFTDPVSGVGCTATEKGGALYVQGSFTMNGGEITGCTAKNGAAVYATDTFTQNGGEVTGNNATVGGAMEASGSVRFKGSAKVYGNTINSELGHNVYLNEDSAARIYATGLADDAEVNVFVTDAMKGKRGYAGRMFGAYTDDANLNRIISERFIDSKDQPLHGTTSTTFEGDKRIAWQGEDTLLTVVSAADGTTPVADARFEITRDGWDGNSVIWRGTTDTSGQVIIPWTGYEDRDRVSGDGDGGAVNFINGSIENGVYNRKYQLSQIQAGDNYALPGGKWIITVDAANGITASVSQTTKTNYTYALGITGTNLERNAWTTKNDPGTLTVNYNMNAGGDSVSFVDENGTPLANPQTVSFTDHASVVGMETVYPVGPTRENYRFVGWNTKADGSGIAYAACGPLYYRSDAVNGAMTLYAQWVPAESVARVSFDNGANWSYYGALITGTYDGEIVNGAFDAAKNRILNNTGTVIIETLYETHPRFPRGQAAQLMGSDPNVFNVLRRRFSLRSDAGFHRSQGCRGNASAPPAPSSGAVYQAYIPFPKMPVRSPFPGVGLFLQRSPCTVLSV